MNRRNFVKYSAVACTTNTIIIKEASAIFPIIFSALIGRTSIGVLASIAGTARAARLEGVTRSLRYNSSPQFTVTSAAEIASNLKPRLRVRNDNSQRIYRSPRIFIREVNLTFNEIREFSIPSFDFNPSFNGDFNVNIGNIGYSAGCDYIREIQSVDECGCEARWQPEVIAILGLPNENNNSASPNSFINNKPRSQNHLMANGIFPYGSDVSCPQIPLGNGMARCQ